MKTKKNYDFFISYGKENKNNAKKLASYLDDNGFNVWFDYWNLASGDNILESMQNAIKESKVVLVLIDDSYLSSMWEEIELESVFMLNKKIIPIIEKEEDISILPKLLLNYQHMLIDYDNLDIFIKNLIKIDILKIDFILKKAKKLYEKGTYEESLLLYKQALELQYKEYGKSDVNIATSYNNLASIYQATGEYDKALPLLKKSLKINQKVLGEDHPSVATTYNNLSILYYHIGNFNKAFQYMKQSVKIWKKILPIDHPNLINSIEYLNIIEKQLI